MEQGSTKQNTTTTTKPPAEVTAQRVILMRELLARHEGVSAGELIEATETSKQNVYQWLHKLGAKRSGGRWYLGKAG